MTGSIVVMKNLILCALKIRSLSPNFVTQTPQNIAVELSIDALALGDEFSMHNITDVKKKNPKMHVLA